MLADWQWKDIYYHWWGWALHRQRHYSSSTFIYLWLLWKGKSNIAFVNSKLSLLTYKVLYTGTPSELFSFYFPHFLTYLLTVGGRTRKEDWITWIHRTMMIRMKVESLRSVSLHKLYALHINNARFWSLNRNLADPVYAQWKYGAKLLVQFSHARNVQTFCPQSL